MADVSVTCGANKCKETRFSFENGWLESGASWPARYFNRARDHRSVEQSKTGRSQVDYGHDGSKQPQVRCDDHAYIAAVIDHLNGVLSLGV